DELPEPQGRTVPVNRRACCCIARQAFSLRVPKIGRSTGRIHAEIAAITFREILVPQYSRRPKTRFDIELLGGTA
ncbi:hypothetical protein ACC665_33980, partial [Rhizobium ruizarguesonis]